MAKEITEIEIKWGKPIELEMGPAGVQSLPRLLNDADWEKIPEGHGVYFFARYHGGKVNDSYTVRYIGQSRTLRKRIDQHLKKNMKLMTQLKHETRKGSKVLVVGELKHQPNRREEGKQMAIKIVEKALIDKVIADKKGDLLFNERGTKLKVNSISFAGSTVGQELFGKKIKVS